MTAAQTAFARQPMLLDEMAMARTILRLAHEVAERHPHGSIVLAGIRTRGVPLAQRLQRALAALGHPDVRLLELDLREYRDDRPRRAAGSAAALTASDGTAARIDADTVVLVDDVIFTGRTFRAALDALVDAGRPAAVELLVLVDRGHRELPLRPTYVGKNVPTAARQRVAVRFRETDGVDGAWVVEAAG